MAGKKDTVIFYQNQIRICKKHLTADQFGRLMSALFALDDGEDPEVDDDIALAFDFMSLQQRLDKEKYDKIVERNRKNGAKGGRPKKNKNPKNPDGYFKNHNDDVEIMMSLNNDDEEIHDSVFSLGAFSNVELTEEEYFLIRSTYERADELIDKVSLWLRDAKHSVPDHYALCVKFATNDKWPKRKVIEHVEIPKVEDSLSEEEQAEQVAKMKGALGGMFKA